MRGNTQPITFRNRSGAELFGILHLPERPVTQDIAVILLSPGVKSRVAPHRMYNRLADMMAANGYLVLRFDFHGLGDSGGEIDATSLADLYGSIQVGRFVEDTRTSLDWMARQLGCRRFVLGGLCGGALTGLLAAANDSRVVGILGIGLPVMLQGSNLDYRRYMTHGQLNRLGSAYMQKLLRPEAWLRFFTLRTDYRLMLQALRARLGRVSPSSGAQIPTADDNTNPLVAPAFRTVLRRGCQILLLFGGADRLHWEFEEKYAQRHRSELARHASQFEIEVLPQANHVLTFTEWQHDMLQRSERWLLEKFPTTPPLVMGAARATA